MRNRIGMRWKEISRDRWAFGGWVFLGLGLLLLTAVSIPLSIWLIQRSGEAGPGVVGSGAISAPGSLSDTASFGDSAKLEIRRNSAAAGTADASPISVVGEEDSGRELPAGDVATFGDAAILGLQQVPEADPGETRPSGGGTGETASMTDSAQFVVRDSDGNIKDQGVVR